MRLWSKNGTDLEVTIRDYEFPHIENDAWDSNWLVAAVRVTTPQGSWNAVGTPFLTDEVVSLARWFHEISVGGEVEKQFEFFQPLLYFEYEGGIDGAVLIRVGFGLEYKPPWVERDRVGAEENVFEFRLATGDLESASISLLSDAQRFPVRGYR